MEKDITLIIGASLNTSRFSNKAIKLLQSKGLKHIALGLKKGEVGKTLIVTERKNFQAIDTITLYVGSEHQDQEMIDYIIGLNPRRVIFNPGSESLATSNALIKAGIQFEMACTLVLWQTGQY